MKGTTTTDIFTLSLHDALPISGHCTGEPTFVALKRAFGERYLYAGLGTAIALGVTPRPLAGSDQRADRKSTRLNSSHPSISYAVFCLKKKMKPIILPISLRSR